MAAVVADTHAAVWYLTNSPRLSPGAARALDGASAAGDSIIIPSISLVELPYLVEKGRLPSMARQRLVDAISQQNGPYELAPLDGRVAAAVELIDRNRVPDMPIASLPQQRSPAASPSSAVTARSAPHRFRQSGRALASRMHPMTCRSFGRGGSLHHRKQVADSDREAGDLVRAEGLTFAQYYYRVLRADKNLPRRDGKDVNFLRTAIPVTVGLGK